ncbi:MAG: uroporphyrinogen-III synthase [Bacteroidota bacterium]
MSSLKNKTILVTKSKADAEKSVRVLYDEEAQIIYFPTIKVVPVVDSPELINALRVFDEFDYLIFTSSNAVVVFTKIAEQNELDLSNIKIAAVGKSTAEKCESFGIRINIIPDEFSARGLINKFSELDLGGKKIFVPCSKLSRDELCYRLTELGAEVLSVPVYDLLQNDLNELRSEYEQIHRTPPDVLVFTSPSSFDNFRKLAGVDDKYFERSLICAIGSTTEQAIRQYGYVVHIVPKIFSLQGAAEAIAKYFQLTANIA